jgi:hypothetical protein
MAVVFCTAEIVAEALTVTMSERDAMRTEIRASDASMERHRKEGYYR